MITFLRNSARTFWEMFRAPLVAFLLSLLLSVLLLLALKEDPRVLWDALATTLFTGFGLGYTLFYATPLIFTGLSVALCFQCGLFNIGAEGQLYIGALALMVGGLALPTLPKGLALPWLCLCAAVAGGLWGGLAGYLKSKRGSHEVIVTILLNFIAIAWVGYAILYPLKNPATQNPQTYDLASAYSVPTLESFGLEFFRTTPVNAALPLAVALCFLCHYFLFHTTYGYELRIVGASARAGRFAGISVGRNTVLAFALAGACAGLVGINDIAGYHHHLIEGFSPQYGFTGIAVALLARSRPLGILLSAFLFGALQNSSRELEFLSERVTKELAMVLQGTLIAFIAADRLIERWFRQRKQKRVGKPSGTEAL